MIAKGLGPAWPDQPPAKGEKRQKAPSGRTQRLTGPDLVVYAYLIDVTDNGSRRHPINRARAAARTGATWETVRSSIDHLAHAGLLTITERDGRGAPRVIRVPRAKPRHRFDVPVALLWPTDDPKCPPRWGRSDTGLALRSVLAILNRADHSLAGPLKATADSIARSARLTTRDYKRGLVVILGPGPSTGRLRKEHAARVAPSGGWLRSDPQTRLTSAGDFRQEASWVTVAWALLPTQVVGYRSRVADSRPVGQTAPDADENPPHGPKENPPHGSDENSPRLDPGTPGHHLRSNTTYASSPDPLARETEPAAPRTPTAGGGGDEVKPTPKSDLRLLDLAATGSRHDVEQALQAALADAGGDPTRLSATDWSALVIANARLAAPVGHSLPLTTVDARRLLPQVASARAAGWDPHTLAAAITVETDEGIRSLYATVHSRIGNSTATAKDASRARPGQVWMEPAKPAPTRAERDSAAANEVQSARRDPANYSTVL
ncbi:hypothetical protein [Oryzihumus leptocrescens]|uniref:hypothetical protein n=1 Tax=Oryzihumus leptocrescens TaxID=297536 RepID=UPI001151EF70|nr:hypothetical protein [Oryzihumus leptocrescens]